MERRKEMKRRDKRYFMAAAVQFLIFVLFTLAVKTVDVRPIGPQRSEVGFASLNGFVFGLLGESRLWYEITDWMGIAAVLTASGFALLGLFQLIRRKSIRRVDRSLIVMGTFYAVVLAFYAFFEVCIVNYRPVILEEGLEASYPSSHSMAVLCIMAAAAMEFHQRLKNRTLRMIAETVSVLIIVVTVAGRLLSGVHWLTDIIGGLLLGAALVMLYYSISSYDNKEGSWGISGGPKKRTGGRSGN